MAAPLQRVKITDQKTHKDFKGTGIYTNRGRLPSIMENY
jgi:hypothetical protein